MKRALFALAVMALPAKAAPTDEIFALYAKGDYAQAEKMGEAAHTAPGYAIAARAVLADEVLRDQPCLECLQRAEKLARAAGAADPHHDYGQNRLVVLLGFLCRF